MGLYNYSTSQVTSRASSGGRDLGRKHTIDRLVQQATQPPHDDDQAAIGAIMSLSGVPGGSGLDQAGKPTQGFADADARNYGQLALQQLTGRAPTYEHQHDGSFNLGHALGSVLKYGAPIAAGLIPGLGPLAAAGIGMAGNTAGRALAGDQFSLGSMVLSGALPGLSQYAGVPYKLFGGGPAAAGTAGNMTQGMGGIASGAGGGVPGAASAAASAGKGILGTGITGGDLLHYAPLGIGAIGAYQGAQDMSKANALRERAVKLAEQDYAERAPYRMNALRQASQPLPQAPDLTSVFADRGNPFYRPGH